MQTEQTIKTVVDASAYSTLIATLIGWLPSIAALFSITWFAIQITEKATGKSFHELLRGVCDKVSGAARSAWDKLRG